MTSSSEQIAHALKDERLFATAMLSRAIEDIQSLHRFSQISPMVLIQQELDYIDIPALISWINCKDDGSILPMSVVCDILDIEPSVISSRLRRECHDLRQRLNDLNGYYSAIPRGDKLKIGQYMTRIRAAKLQPPKSECYFSDGGKLFLFHIHLCPVCKVSDVAIFQRCINPNKADPAIQIIPQMPLQYCPVCRGRYNYNKPRKLGLL